MNEPLIILLKRGQSVDGIQEEPWCVLHVLANHEKKVARHLAVYSLEHYLPQYTERSKWSDRTVTLERPLFLGYVFARFMPEAKRIVISTPGVMKVLGKNHADMVDNIEIDRIRRALSAGHVLRSHPPVSVGMQVRVHRGIFDGVEGLVTELRRNCKVIIRLQGTDECFSLEASIEDIEVLGNTVTTAASSRSLIHGK
jgi:transcription antitermination factor NusG